MASEMNLHDGMSHSEDTPKFRIKIEEPPYGYVLLEITNGSEVFRYFLYTEDTSPDYMMEVAEEFEAYSRLLRGVAVAADEEE